MGVTPSFFKVVILNFATETSCIFPKLWSILSISFQSPFGSTILHEARLSSAVPHNTAFFPPAFIATLPPIHEASAEVGSVANSKPAFEAVSIALLVTTPTSQYIVGTG